MELISSIAEVAEVVLLISLVVYTAGLDKRLRKLEQYYR